MPDHVRLRQTQTAKLEVTLPNGFSGEVPEIDLMSDLDTGPTPTQAEPPPRSAMSRGDMTSLSMAVRGEGTDTLELDVYDVVGSSWQSVGLTAKDVRRTLRSSANAKTIKLRVNSRGGDVFEGIAIYNLLRDHSANVVADVDALAASIASVILMAADEIRIAPGAMVMIHNPWALSLGEADDLRSTADLLDKVRGQMADIYAARTGLAHERLLEMMAAETWMTPEEAKANGFADVIKSGSQGATKARALASLNLSGLTVPREFHAAVERARTALAASPGSEPGTDRPSTSSELRASSPEQLAAQVADILDERRGRAPAPARAEREQQPPQSAGPTPPPAEPPPAVADRPITAEEGLQLLEELRASRKPSPEELASQVADILERRRQYR